MSVEVPDPDMEKRQAADTRGHDPVPATKVSPDSRVARCRCRDGCRNAALKINSRASIQLSASVSWNAFDAGQEITVDLLVGAGIAKAGQPVKVLANGELSKSLVVNVDKVSGKARELIEKAGGTVVAVSAEEK